MPIQSVNPYTGRVIRTYEALSSAAVDARLRDAERAQGLWRRHDLGERAEGLRAAAGILRKRKDDYAALMASEMGKPIVQGRAECEKCAWTCEYYAEAGAGHLRPEVVPTEALGSWVEFEPLGVVLAIMPWNFPFWQVFRFAAPALMAGNAAVLKHASNVPGCATAIERIFRDAGFPDGLFSTLLIESSEVARVIESPHVHAVTLTGSTPAGRAVASVAGGALKKTVLELGGSDPYLILDDLDLDHAAEVCATARLVNGGQSCIAAKRFIVIESIREEFERLLVQKMSARRMGDPMDEETDIGPQARADLRDGLHDQVRRSMDMGARLMLGGEIPDMPGAFYPPTVLTDVKGGMPVHDEETFGPVAAVIGVSGEEDAIATANNTIFGLGAAVFTSDREQGERVVGRLRAGACFINDYVRSDPRLPFGGVKESGYGRELGSFGIREFVNVKTIYRN